MDATTRRGDRLEFAHGISLEDVDGGMLVRQYNDAYLARKWKPTPAVAVLVVTALDNGLRWMIREGHPQAHARWPAGQGRVYIAFSPTREDHWSMAIDRFNPKSGTFGAAVFNGKYHHQFVQNDVPFEFEKRNVGAGHMVVQREQVLPTLTLLGSLDHEVLYLRRTESSSHGFVTEYDIQRALMFQWASTPFATAHTLVTDEFPVDGGLHSRRIDILARTRSGGGHLVIEVKRAEASLEALRQIEDYLSALRRRDDFAFGPLRGALVAERIPLAVREAAGRIDVEAYEASYPLSLQRVA
jgi:hypothetical protein